jgi:FAD dependent monooxygenase
MYQTHDHGSFIHTFTLTKFHYFFLYVKLDEPTQWPTRTRYTDADAEKLAAQYADRQVIAGVPFRDLWNNRIRYKMASVEEGVQTRWSWKRIVLLGDSAHKVGNSIPP